MQGLVELYHMVVRSMGSVVILLHGVAHLLLEAVQVS